MNFDMNAERKISQSVRYLYLKLQILLSFKFSNTLLQFLLCLKSLNVLAFTFPNVSELLAVPKMLILDHKMSRVKVRLNILTHRKFSYILRFENAFRDSNIPKTLYNPKNKSDSI